MSQGNELKFQRSTAAKTEFEDRNKGPKNRHHRDGTAGLRKSPVLPQPCGILSKDSLRFLPQRKDGEPEYQIRHSKSHTRP